MSAKKVKARKMWQHPAGGVFALKQRGALTHAPVLVLPATPEAYETMVEQVSKRKVGGRYPVEIGTMNARGALAAIGITQPNKSP